MARDPRHCCMKRMDTNKRFHKLDLQLFCLGQEERMAQKNKTLKD